MTLPIALTTHRIQPRRSSGTAPTTKSIMAVSSSGRVLAHTASSMAGLQRGLYEKQLRYRDWITQDTVCCQVVPRRPGRHKSKDRKSNTETPTRRRRKRYGKLCQNRVCSRKEVSLATIEVRIICGPEHSQQAMKLARLTAWPVRKQLWWDYKSAALHRLDIGGASYVGVNT